MAYSMDLRTRVLADSDAGMGTRAVATKYSVSESWVRRLKQRRRERGEITPRQRRPAPPKWLPHAGRLQALVCEQADATLAELRGRLGVELSITTLWRALQQLRLTFKKSPARCGAGSAGRARAAGRLAGADAAASCRAVGVSR
jgi:transposase